MRHAVAILLGLVASSAAAEPLSYRNLPTVQAYAGLYGGFISTEEGPGFALGGSGRASVALAGGWNFQGDVEFASRKLDEVAFAGGAHYFHFYRRDPARYAVGVFSGFQGAGTTAARPFGLEAQLYGPRFTLYGQGAVWVISDSPASHALQLRVQATAFLAANTSLSADLMYTAFDASYRSDAFTLAGTAAHRFAASPLGLFARLRWDRFKRPGDADEVSGVLGLSIFADGPAGTLQSSGRVGPAMNVLPLPVRILAN